MRERLIAAFAGLTVLVLTVFAVAHAYSLADYIRAQEQRKVERSVVLLAIVLGDRVQDGDPVTGRFLQSLLNEAEHIEYVDDGGLLVEASAPGHPEGAHDQGDLMLTRPVPGGGTVTLSRPASLVEERIAEQLLPVVELGILLVALAVLAGWLAARWLSRPFQELATVATEIGRGRFDVPIKRYPIPEAAAIGESLRRSAGELDALLRRERQFFANASHELRTPITALRLELEDLTLDPANSPEVNAQLARSLAEVDRLSGTVTGLLDRARGHQREDAVTVDLSALTRGTVDRWRPLAGGRVIVGDWGSPVPVRLPSGPVRRVLDVLLENALKHGAGTVTVTVADLERYVEVRVRDQGTNPPGRSLLRRETGDGPVTGLAMAGEIADSLGGHLRLEDDAGTTFTLLLPKPTA